MSMCIQRKMEKRTQNKYVEKKESPWTRSNHYVMLFYKIGSILLLKTQFNAKMKFFKMNFPFNEFHFQFGYFH